jgi:hypothetical protein
MGVFAQSMERGITLYMERGILPLVEAKMPFTAAALF